MTLAISLILAAVLGVLLYRTRNRRQREPIAEPHPTEAPKRARRPRAKGLSQEEREVAQEQFVANVKKNHQAAFERDKASALAIGSKQYTWRSCGDDDVCPVCKQNDGKKFSWHKAPPHGHPGYAACSSEGYCRCNAEPVLPKL